MKTGKFPYALGYVQHLAFPYLSTPYLKSTCIRVKRSSGEEIDDFVYALFVSVHLPVPTNEKFTTHFRLVSGSLIEVNQAI